jgi:hypothetical protein
MKRFLNKFYLLISNGYFACGLLALGWSPVMVIFGYWAEVVANYFFTIIKIIVLISRRKASAGKLLFFLFHYGLFMAGHTIFFIILSFMVAKRYPFIVDFLSLFVDPAAVSRLSAFKMELIRILGVVALTAAAGFFITFIKGRQYETLSFDELLGRSYGTVVLLHVVLFLGVGIIAFFDLPGVLTIIVVVIQFLFQWFDVGRLKQFPSSQAGEQQ